MILLLSPLRVLLHLMVAWEGNLSSKPQCRTIWVFVIPKKYNTLTERRINQARLQYSTYYGNLNTNHQCGLSCFVSPAQIFNCRSAALALKARGRLSDQCYRSYRTKKHCYTYRCQDLILCLLFSNRRRVGPIFPLTDVLLSFNYCWWSSV